MDTNVYGVVGVTALRVALRLAAGFQPAKSPNAVQPAKSPNDNG